MTKASPSKSPKDSNRKNKLETKKMGARRPRNSNTAQVFHTGGSQAVRLPKSNSFNDGVDCLTIVKHGSSITLIPNTIHPDFFTNLPLVSASFPPDRAQPRLDACV